MNDAWTPFLEWLSHFAVSGLILLPALIYWCIDKKKGFFILTATSACLVVNSVIKLTACVYRPWIRDPRITPAGDAIKEATGYSFPSGHTAAAGPMLGGTACLGRYAEKHCVRFRPTGLNAKGIAVGVAGLVPIVLVRKVLDKVLVSVFGVLSGGMLGRCALVLVIILVWPVVIRMICGQEECRTQKDRLHNGDNTK